MLSVLHVDNNFFYKEIVRQVSIEKEFQYYSAKNPAKAFEILHNHEIDLIVTGLEFKEDDGEHFISQIMGSPFHRVPIIVLTSTEVPEVRMRLLGMGITDYLSKDRFMEYLVNYINKVHLEDMTTVHLKKMRIAVLDDNHTYLEIVREIFVKNNLDHVDYYDHPDALLKASDVYDIYLVDNILPDISGEQVMAALRERNEYAVIIAVSSLRSHNIISHILTGGADDYVTKPFSENVFMARIKANVRTHSLMEQLREKNAILEQMVKTDGLTGLYNHKHIMESLDSEVERARRYKIPFSIIMLDLDRFKNVNDTYGHHIGDEVLVSIGKLLKNDSRKIDMAGRYGGEEFIVLLPGSDEAGACIYAERLAQQIAGLKFSEMTLSVTVSGGIATYKGEPSSDLIKLADERLYKAKKTGRNKFVCE